MAPFLFRCPQTGQHVQGWNASDADDPGYQAVRCEACTRTHLVEPATGKVAGQDEDE